VTIVVAMRQYLVFILINFPTTAPNLMQGGYTNLLLLLGLDQNASAARKL
jgi:hypothetical protein